MEFGIIVHGGAGDIPDALDQAHRAGVEKACAIAYSILERGGKAIDAAEACIVAMEDNSVFDAGSGSFFNELGEIEMDAMIATDTWQIGSVCAIKNVKNPVKVARLVSEQTKHVLLVGEGALNFAIDQGIQKIPQEELGVSPELELRYHTTDFHEMVKAEKKLGTVGCVCLDRSGHFAIATSTGGSAMKKQGRVGDTALWGAGGYVNQQGAAAATGVGEDLIRVLLTRSAVTRLEQEKSPQKSADYVITKLTQRLQSEGGVIVMDKSGFGYSFNTSKMSIAFRDNSMESIKILMTKRDF